MEAIMKIVPERVTVVPDLQTGELTIIMDGFRLTLSAEEARLLSYALVHGTKQLHSDPARAPSSTAPGAFSAKPTLAGSHETKPAVDPVAGDVIRSLTA
jgi:hypothetical protein